MENHKAPKLKKRTPPTKSEVQLQFMAESMPQKIFTASPEGKIDYLSHQWEEYIGQPAAQFLDRGWDQLFTDDEFKHIAKLWRHAMKTGEPFFVEHRLRRHDGEHRWHITQARAMRDKNGTIVKWFGSSTDINDTKTSQEREHQLSIQALSLTREREKLLALNASKDEFISLASHQLRTPATIVKQYLNMILDGFVGDISPELREMIQKANDSNDRQIEIVDDLLRVARLDAGKIKLVKNVVNIIPLVQEVVTQHLTILEERRQTASISYNESGISATIDRPRMKMVLENLLDNASKYSPEGKKIAITITKRADAVAIAIKDEGVGIDEDEMPKLFRKFSRLNNPLSVAVGGTGLGLYWAKRIVTLHGGMIDVRSKPGSGSVFTVILPGKPVSL